MRNRAIAALVLPLFVACGSSCDSTDAKARAVETTFRAVAGMGTVGMELFRVECRKRAYECFKAQDQHCQPLRDCVDARNKFVQSIVAAHRAIALARTFVVEGQPLMAKRTLERAIALLIEAKNTLDAFGLEV